MAGKLLNVGFGNTVMARRVLSVLHPGSAPMRRLREEAREDGRLLDATQGRKTRSVIVLDSNHVVLSAVQAETINQRLEQASLDAGSLQLGEEGS